VSALTSLQRQERESRRRIQESTDRITPRIIKVPPRAAETLDPHVVITELKLITNERYNEGEFQYKYRTCGLTADGRIANLSEESEWTTTLTTTTSCLAKITGAADENGCFPVEPRTITIIEEGEICAS
jgi:hypothetical protein